MKNRFMYLAMCFFVAIAPSTHLYSQCLTAPTATCTNTEPLVTDGEILNNGTSKWYYGPATTINMLTLKGGTLIVCGNLTVDKFYMDSGKIFIQPGARFVIGNGEGAGLVIRGHSYFYNYGTMEVLRNLSFENGWTTAAKPNVLINASAASVLKMNNQYFVINNANSWFVNKGKAYFHGLITDPQAAVRSVCLGKGSQTVMTVLYNKVKNSYYAPEPYACVSVSEFSQLWDTLSNATPYINVCLGLTHRTDSTCMIFGCKPSWGMSSLFRGCISCGSIHILQTRFTSFYAEQHNDGNSLYWRIEEPAETGMFYIEMSEDGQQFKTIHSFAVDKQNNVTEYAYFDALLSTGINYYRIKYVDTVSKFTTYTPIVSALQKTSVSMQVYPNPFSQQLFVSLPGIHSSATALIANAYGVIISNQPLVRSGNRWQVKLAGNMPAGFYSITITAAGKQWKQKLIKQ